MTWFDPVAILNGEGIKTAPPFFCLVRLEDVRGIFPHLGDENFPMQLFIRCQGSPGSGDHLYRIVPHADALNRAPEVWLGRARQVLTNYIREATARDDATADRKLTAKLEELIQAASRGGIPHEGGLSQQEEGPDQRR